MIDECLGIILHPSVPIPNMPFRRTVGKIDHKRMRLKVIRRISGGYKCFAVCGKAAIRDRQYFRLRARRRWLGKVPNR